MHTKTNRIILLMALMLLFLTNISLYADSRDNTMANQTEKKWALQFGITENFQLEPFAGISTALVRKLSDVSAIRLTAYIDIYHADYPQSIYTDDPDDQSDTESLFQFQYLRLFHTSNKMKLYWGLGPEFGFNYSMTDLIPSIEGLSPRTYEEYFSIVIGIQGLIGAEYALSKSFAVFCEYSTSAQYSHYWSEDKDDDSSLNMFQIDSNPVRFGLSVHF